MWMRTGVTAVVLALAAIPAAPTQAGIIFNRNKPDPAEHVPALIKTLQTDPDPSRRAKAVEELQEQDTRRFPQIVPALVGSLRGDPSDSVRLQAARSLGRMRPVSQQAGYALEQAVNDDASWNVRRAARVSLGVYYVMGYRGSDQTTPGQGQSEEPPMAGGPAPAVPPVQPAPVSAPAVQPLQPAEGSSRWRLFRRSEPEPAPAVRPTPMPTPVQPGRVPGFETEEPPIAGGMATPTPTPAPVPFPAAESAPVGIPLPLAPGGGSSEGPSLFPPG